MYRTGPDNLVVEEDSQTEEAEEDSQIEEAEADSLPEVEAVVSAIEVCYRL